MYSTRRRAEPSNVFHEIRRYLLNRGIDTRIFSFNCIPLPVNLNVASNTDGVFEIDNSFFFQLRRVLPTDSTPMLADVLLCSFEFESDQDSSAFNMQICLNHMGHGTFELNAMHGEIIAYLKTNGWSVDDETNQRNAYILMKNFNDLKTFFAQYDGLHCLLGKHSLLNSQLLPMEPVF